MMPFFVLLFMVLSVATGESQNKPIPSFRNFTNIRITPGSGNSDIPLVKGAEACPDRGVLAGFNTLRYGGCPTEFDECIYVPDDNTYPLELVFTPIESVTMKFGVVYFYVDAWGPGPVTYIQDAPPGIPPLEANTKYTLSSDFKPDFLPETNVKVFFKFYMFDVRDRPIICVQGNLKVLSSYGPN